MFENFRKLIKQSFNKYETLYLYQHQYPLIGYQSRLPKAY